METANTIITDALQELVVQADEAPIQASEAQSAIRYMNRMMYQFDAEGISLGYSFVESLGDTVTVPIGALNGVVYNLAIALAKQYEIPVSADLIQKAKDAKKAMRALSFRIGPTDMPSTLPLGSGNQGCGTHDQRFYTGHQNAINTETNRNILQEDRNEWDDDCSWNDDAEWTD